MAKSKPIGVRFDMTHLAQIMTEAKVTTYQKVVDYLMDFYLKNPLRDSSDSIEDTDSKPLKATRASKPLIAKATKDTPPERLEGESAFDFAFRKNEWKCTQI